LRGSFLNKICGTKVWTADMKVLYYTQKSTFRFLW